VVIVGAGQAGVSLAARLRRDGFTDVALIDPRQTHRYRPLLSYVGGGQATLDDLERPQAEVIPPGVTWYRDEITLVDPIARRVETAGGRQVIAEDLVLCPGVTPDWDDVPGSHRAVHSVHGSSNYVDERAPYTWQLVEGFTAGDAVFVVAAGPVPCAGAALKPLFLAADHWRRTGELGEMTVTLIVPVADDLRHPRGGRRAGGDRPALRHHCAHRHPGPPGRHRGADPRARPERHGVTTAVRPAALRAATPAAELAGGRWRRTPAR
jgi:NADPH-dependent 2,4-dienoyl-CoA reductase/sulfur reductase-like enzyme